MHLLSLSAFTNVFTDDQLLADEEISPTFIQVISDLNSDLKDVENTPNSNSKVSKADQAWEAALEECDQEIERDVMKEFTDSSSPIN